MVMVPMGPERWGPDSEEWVIHLNYPVDDPRAQSDEQVEADVRAALGLPDTADGDPQDHALVGRRRDGLGVPRRPGVPARRRRAPPPADRRARPRPARSTTPRTLLEARRRAAAARRRRSCSTPTSPSAAPSTSATPSARSRTPSTTSRSATPLGVSHENTQEENWRNLRRMWSGDPEDAEHRSEVLRVIRDAVDGVRRAERRVRLHLRVGGGRSRRQPRARVARTTSASTSRRRGRARRCPTPGSTTRTAAAGRSRTSSHPGASC